MGAKCVVTNSQWSAHFLLLDIHKYVSLESLIKWLHYVLQYIHTHIYPQEMAREVAQPQEVAQEQPNHFDSRIDCSLESLIAFTLYVTYT